ncbi:MAG: CPBP family intramembrane metalloprotease [Lachnospiraceae bacterium]|nr:CPBP family intramembrane metalloprotease [Lachnospiraceae bacterium]
MNKRKFFSTIGAAYFLLLLLMLVLPMILAAIVQAAVPGSLYRYPLLYWIVSLAPQYLAAMPICVRIMRRLPAVNLYRNRLGGGGAWFSTLCIAIFIMEAGNIIGNLVSTLIGRLSGLGVSSGVEELLSEGNLGMIFLFTVILAPILEELIFRKLLIDRAVVFGDRTAILLSALLFGLAHGNFYQLFYAFGLGCLFGYIYIRTGKIAYTISFHMAVNFLGGFVSSFLLERLEYSQWSSGDYAQMMYSMFSHIGALLGLVLFVLLMIGLSIAGLVKFIQSIRKAKLNTGEYEMPAGKTAKAVFGNAGMILFLIMAAVTFIIETVS